MSRKEKNILKIVGSIGIISIIVFTVFICFSIHLSPWFSLTDNWISELAGSFGLSPTWSALGIGSILFNLGLILTGIFGMIFSVMIIKLKLFNTCLGIIGTVSLYVEMFAIFCVGLFPVTVGLVHALFSSIMFATIPIVLIVIGYELVKIYGRNWMLLTNVLFFISAFSFIIFQFGGSKAVAELVALYSLFLFLLTFCIGLVFTDPSSLKLNDRFYSSKYHRSVFKIKSILGSIWFKT